MAYFRQIKLEELERVFASTHPTWIIAALVAFAGDFASRIERWRLMLRRDSPSLTWRSCAGPFLVRFAANNVLPFRAGDVLRFFAFNRRLRTSAGAVLATLLVERLLDLLMVLFLLSVALVFFGMDAARFSGVGGSAVLFAGAAVILFILLYPSFFLPFAQALEKFIARQSPKRNQKICHEIDKTLTTLQHLSAGRTMIKLVLWSMAAWSAEGCVFWFADLSIPSIANPLAGWHYRWVPWPHCFPSTPDYVCTFDYFTARAMTEAGNSTIAVAAYALLVHALSGSGRCISQRSDRRWIVKYE